MAIAFAFINNMSAYIRLISCSRFGLSFAIDGVSYSGTRNSVFCLMLGASDTQVAEIGRLFL